MLLNFTKLTVRTQFLTPRIQKNISLNTREITNVRNRSSMSIDFLHYIKVNQSHYRLAVPRGFQEVKVPTLCDNGPEW